MYHSSFLQKSNLFFNYINPKFIKSLLKSLVEQLIHSFIAGNVCLIVYWFFDRVAACFIYFINSLVYFFIILWQLNMRIIANFLAKLSANLIIILIQFKILTIAHLFQYFLHYITHQHFGCTFLFYVRLYAQAL